MPPMLERGFTLIEISVSVGIISLILTGSILLISSEFDSVRQAEYYRAGGHVQERDDRRSADCNEGIPHRFWLCGDMGSLPSSLQDLWIKGSQPGLCL